MIEVKIPTVGESISEVQVGQWLKQEGDWVNKDEDLVEIETEKASVQILAPAAGFLRNVLKQEEEFAVVGDVIASIEPSDAPSNPAAGSAPPADAASAAPAANPSAANPSAANTSAPAPAAPSASGDGDKIMPAAQRMLDDFNLKASQVQATGPGGRLLKEDVQAFLRSGQNQPPAAAPTPAPAATPAPPRQAARETSLVTAGGANRGEEIKPMSMIRRTIASRLVQAQQTAALLTTFNEINMRPVMELRKKYRDAFVDKHGVKLGFMSFFAKAAVEGLRRFPAVNAEVRGNNVVMRHYYDIGIAIGGGKGLVVPVLRNVEEMSFAKIENSIAEFADRAGANQLQPADLEGGTFTISNGGIYGSLLSTPIVNPPQSGILGLHSIQERPVAERGEVVIRPMMYVALTYDHRVVDGREAVSFLKTIKDVMEDPARLFLEV